MSSTYNATVIEIERVKLRSGGRTLADDFSLVLPDPGVYMLVGGNGSGKSIIASMLAGRLKPQHGAVRIDGEPLYRWLGGYHAPVLYYDTHWQPPPLLTIEEYMHQEIGLLGGSAAALAQSWRMMEELLDSGREAVLNHLPASACCLIQFFLASIAPVRLALLDGQLSLLDHVHLEQAAEILGAPRLSEEKFVMLTSLRPVAEMRGVRDILTLADGLPVHLQPPVNSDSTAGRPAGPAALLRIGLRDWVAGSRTMTSGKTYQFVSFTEDGMRIRPTGSLEDTLGEIMALGYAIERVVWE